MVPLLVGVVPFGLAYAVLARDAGLSVVETQALSLLVFAGSAQVSAVGLVAARCRRSRDRAHDVPAQRAPRALRSLARPHNADRRVATPSGRIFPHRRGVRCRRSQAGAVVRVPARHRAESLRELESLDTRGSVARVGDTGSGGDRRRPRVPAGLPGLARAARPHADRGCGGRSRGHGRLGHRARASGRHPDTRGRSRRQPARRLVDAQHASGRRVHLDDAARDVA